MSRLLLLSTGAPAPSGGGPGPGPSGPSTSYPATSDPVVLAARPDGRRIAALTVDTDFSTSATNFHTVGAAITKAQELQDAAVQQTSLAPGEFSVLGSPKGPDYRVDIFIGPGTYSESIGSSSFINLIGTSGNPDDTVITTAVTGGGTFHPFGPCYLESIRFNALTAGGSPDTGPKYAMHITTGGPGAVVAVDCKFMSTNPGGAGSVGMDGGGGLFVYFNSCTFSHMATGGMNLHGGSGNTTPVTVVWENCTNNGPWAYDEIGSATDEVWLIGSTPTTLNTGGTTNDYTTGTPPRPDGALGTLGIGYYYPSDINNHPFAQTFGEADQASFSPPVGRIYYIPVDVPAAIHRTHTGVLANAVGGVVGTHSIRTTTPPATGAPAVRDSGTLSAGINDVEAYYYNTFYPGETVVYAVVRITSGSPLLQGSLALAAGAYYSDDNGTTITAVPGGSRVPVVRLRSAT